ncbi:hypothetical protein EDD36DRAFT_84590 [Exophiala viscosa]|uniref:Uncharacterized protein n=1 Tax=Exophiala viscosa TaxID=2486360 RepID=A0AAN6DPY7_9EURO|nr:hypothetical protein EDD36DRAFT_84590 [Exophiala viscosa]
MNLHLIWPVSQPLLTNTLATAQAFPLPVSLGVASQRLGRDLREDAFAGKRCMQWLPGGSFRHSLSVRTWPHCTRRDGQDFHNAHDEKISLTSNLPMLTRSRPRRSVEREDFGDMLSDKASVPHAH